MMTMFDFDGILLKPCLLQPCFHVAGIYDMQFVGFLRGNSGNTDFHRAESRWEASRNQLLKAGTTMSTLMSTIPSIVHHLSGPSRYMPILKPLSID